MTLEQIIFFVTALVSLGAALMVVTVRNLVHAALWLVVTLFGVAVLYVLLQAGFLAVVQVVVYIGAIAILMIFAIMLTRNITAENRTQLNENWVWSLIIALVAFFGVSFMLFDWLMQWDRLAEPISDQIDSVALLGAALTVPDAYLLPFELASVLLLAALVGSLVVAQERK